MQQSRHIRNGDLRMITPLAILLQRGSQVQGQGPENLDFHWKFRLPGPWPWALGGPWGPFARGIAGERIIGKSCYKIKCVRAEDPTLPNIWPCTRFVKRNLVGWMPTPKIIIGRMIVETLLVNSLGWDAALSAQIDGLANQAQQRRHVCQRQVLLPHVDAGIEAASLAFNVAVPMLDVLFACGQDVVLVQHSAWPPSRQHSTDRHGQHVLAMAGPSCTNAYKRFRLTIKMLLWFACAWAWC